MYYKFTLLFLASFLFFFSARESPRICADKRNFGNGFVLNSRSFVDIRGQISFSKYGNKTTKYYLKF